MKTLIMGSSGYLGSSLTFDFEDKKNLVLTHNLHRRFERSYRFDFFSDDIAQIISKENVGAVVIASKIEMMHDSRHPVDEQSLTRAMIKFSRAVQDLRVVYVSSDGIFDGTKGDYKEDNLPFPSTPYGRNLLICESILEKLVKNLCIVRTSYLFGYSGEQLDERTRDGLDELRLSGQYKRYVDMFKSPIHVCLAANIINQLTKMDYKGLVHVAGDRMSIFDFFKESLEALGYKTKGLVAVPMPEDPLILRDTSLNYDRMQQLTGIKPMSVPEAYSKYLGQPLKK